MLSFFSRFANLFQTVTASWHFHCVCLTTFWPFTVFVFLFTILYSFIPYQRIPLPCLSSFLPSSPLWLSCSPFLSLLSFSQFTRIYSSSFVRMFLVRCSLESGILCVIVLLLWDEMFFGEVNAFLFCQQSMLHLAPKLNYVNLNDELLKHFARLQCRDAEVGLLKNAILILKHMNVM